MALVNQSIEKKCKTPRQKILSTEFHVRQLRSQLNYKDRAKSRF